MYKSQLGCFGTCVSCFKVPLITTLKRRRISFISVFLWFISSVLKRERGAAFGSQFRSCPVTAAEEQRLMSCSEDAAYGGAPPCLEGII